jgi:hypothetical protein
VRRPASCTLGVADEAFWKRLEDGRRLGAKKMVLTKIPIGVITLSRLFMRSNSVEISRCENIDRVLEVASFLYQ